MQKNSLNISNNRDYSLDFIKVFATMAVLKLHAGYEGYGVYAGSIIQYMCGCAVPLFFMISGALALNKHQSEKGYYLKKAKNIFALICLWTILLYVFSCIKHSSLVNPAEVFIKSLFQEGYLGHFWFLWTLMFLYMFSPLLWMVFQTEKSRKTMTVIFLLVTTICFCINITMGIFGQKPFEIFVPQSLRFWSHITYFWLGAVVYNKAQKNTFQDIINKYRKIFLFAVCLIWIGGAFTQYGLCRVVMNITSPEYMFVCPTIIVTNVCLFQCGMVLRDCAVVNKTALLIKYSLGVYILHPFVIVAAQKVMLWVEIGWLVRWIILLVVSTIATAIILRIPYLNRLIKI